MLTNAAIHGVAKSRTQLSDWIDWTELEGKVTCLNSHLYQISPTGTTTSIPKHNPNSDKMDLRRIRFLPAYCGSQVWLGGRAPECEIPE